MHPRLAATWRRQAGVAAAIVGLVAAACGDGADRTADPGEVAGEVVVFAAASLTDAFTEIGDEFVAAHPDASVTFNFAASSELAAQILEGAPAAVFASADLANMTKLTDADATSAEPVVFARNRAEIVVAEGNPFRIETVADLADPEPILVVCAPEAPCGSYATRIFDRAGIEVTPDSYERNVKAVITKIRLGEADVGIAYATDVAAASDDVDGVVIPDQQNVVAEYPIVVVSDSGNPSTASAFVEFVGADRARAILADHGFASP